MDYKKLERDILDLNPGYLEFIQTVKEYTGINNHNLHLIWGYVDLLLDDTLGDEINKELEPFYQLIEQLKPDRDVMISMDECYLNDMKEIDYPIYWRDEYDYPLYGDYIKELDGVVNYNGFMTFTVCAASKTRHRRYCANNNNQ